MEEKKLDFSKPLLSVRRFSSTVASENNNKRKTDKSLAKVPPLPAYKSELKSGPVTNPGTVPFVWEKAPGRPKNESKLQTRAVERPSITPKLPPGRILKVEQQDSDKVAKGTSFIQSRIGSPVSNSQSLASLDNKVTKNERPEEVIQEKASFASDDGDETYEDALDTLSRTESFFTNCSVSGLSGWDDQEVQPSRKFSTDQQARDFMIGRFLPAAKAMASETPQIQYTSRKPLVTQEQSRQVREAVSEAKSRPLNPKWQKVLPHYAQDIGREESEDESDDDDGSENYAPKVCGLFPRFCLLNPIPGLRMEDRILSSAVPGLQGKSIASHRRTAKEHAKTVNYGKKTVESQSDFTKEKDFLGIPEKSKHGFDPHRRGCSSKLLPCESTQFESSCESHVAEKTLYVDSVKMMGPTNHIGDGFETLRKDSSIDKNPSIDSSIEDSKHLVIVDEKAALLPKNPVPLESFLCLYSDNFSDDMHKEMINHPNKIYSEKQGLTKPSFQGSKLDNDLDAISSPKMVECKKIESESKFSFTKKSSDGLIKNPASWRNVKLASDQKIDLESQSHMKLGHQVTSDASSLKHPLSLPLPKAPSESWLKRTLPNVSSRNISSLSNLAAKIHAPSQTPNTASLDPKWEKIVKSSNLHRGHQEQLTTIPEV